VIQWSLCGGHRVINIDKMRYYITTSLVVAVMNRPISRDQ